MEGVQIQKKEHNLAYYSRIWIRERENLKMRTMAKLWVWNDGTSKEVWKCKGEQGSFSSQTYLMRLESENRKNA